MDTMAESRRHDQVQIRISSTRVNFWRYANLPYGSRSSFEPGGDDVDKQRSLQSVREKIYGGSNKRSIEIGVLKLTRTMQILERRRHGVHTLLQLSSSL